MAKSIVDSMQEEQALPPVVQLVRTINNSELKVISETLTKYYNVRYTLLSDTAYSYVKSDDGMWPVVLYVLTLKV